MADQSTGKPLNDGLGLEHFDQAAAMDQCAQLDDLFMVQYQLAKLSLDVHNAKSLSLKRRLPYASLSERAYEYFQ